MKQPMVVTNLRMPQSEYLQIKSIAGELGMSVNEYMSFCAKDSDKRRMMMRKDMPKENTQETIFEAFERIAKCQINPWA